MNIGEKLVELRNYRCLSQNGLAEKAGVSQSHLRRVELGEADITVGLLELLCDAMGVTLRDFFAEPKEQDELSSTLSSLSPKQKACLLAFLKSIQNND